MKKITKKRMNGPQYVYDPGYENGGEPNKKSPLPRQTYSGFDPLSYRDIPILDTAFDINELIKSKNPAEVYASLFGIVAPGLASSRVKDVINRPEFRPAFDVLNLSQHQREKLTQKYGLGYLKKWEKEGYPNVFADGGDLPTTVKAPNNKNKVEPFNPYNIYSQPTIPANTPLSEQFQSVEDTAYNKFYSKPGKIYPSAGEKTEALTKGKLRGATPNKQILEDLVSAADKAGVPREQMLALAANESMFGKGYTTGRYSRVQDTPGIVQQNVISSWDLANQYKPIPAAQFANQKGVPYTRLTKSPRGYTFDVTDPQRYKQSLDSALAKHPEWIDQYKQANQRVIPQGDINYFDLTAEALRDKGIKSAAFNPGDPDYASKIEEARKLVSSDPVLQPYLNRGRENGGIVNRFPEGGNVPRYLTPNSQDIQPIDFLRPIPHPDNEVLDWMKDYTSSPKYKERLSNFYKNTNAVTSNRKSKLDKARVYDDNPIGHAAYYSHEDNSVHANNKEIRNQGIRRDEALAHEFSHGQILSPEEEAYMFSRQRGMKELTPTAMKNAKENKQMLSDYVSENWGHDLAPSELKSDIDSFRFLLEKSKLYKPGTQDMNQNILDKAKKDFNLSDSFLFKRLQKHYSDKDLIDVMNKVAVNNTNNNINNKPMARNGKSMDYPYGYPAYMYPNDVTMFAQGGGLSRDEDYGSKSKPYPMVKKGDFAGGGRSYPIPTRADAVDALRLAGLHGREDVKAKVYKKYPDLKKAYGGPVKTIQNLTGYSMNPQQTYMNDDNQMFEHGGYVEHFNEGSAFCDPTPMYTHDYSNGENGRGGIPPKVYAQGGNMGYNNGSMFRDPLPTYTHGYLDSNNIPPKVYNFGGTAPTVRPNKSFSASPFPYGTASSYHSFYRDNSYMDTFQQGGDISDNTINPIDYLSEDYPLAKSGIHINPANKGKFNALKKRTGKTTEELTHSKNPLTRKRAIFAQNARKWKHEDGGDIYAANGMGVDNPFRRYSTQDNPIYYEGNDNLQTQLPLNSPLQTGSQNSFNTTNSDRGFGAEASFNLGTFGPIMAASALSSNITGQQNRAKQSAIDQRRNIQSGPYYNPYGYGDGYGILANGGRMNKVGMTLSEAMDIIRQHGYDIEVND